MGSQVGIKRKTASRGGATIPVLHFVACLFVVAATVAMPKSSRLVVIAKPGASLSDTMRIVTRSGGTLVAVGGRSWIVVAEAGGSGFAQRLFSNGAVLVLDGAMALLCSSEDVRQ